MSVPVHSFFSEWIFSAYSEEFFTPRICIVCWSFFRQAIQHEVKGKQKQTLLQTTSTVEHQTTLVKWIHRFCEIQQVYMPGFDPKNSVHLEHLASSPNTSTSVHVEDCKLYMLSDLSHSDRHKYCPGCYALWGVRPVGLRVWCSKIMSKSTLIADERATCLRR